MAKIMHLTLLFLILISSSYAQAQIREYIPNAPSYAPSDVTNQYNAYVREYRQWEGRVIDFGAEKYPEYVRERDAAWEQLQSYSDAVFDQTVENIEANQSLSSSERGALIERIQDHMNNVHAQYLAVNDLQEQLATQASKESLSAIEELLQASQSVNNLFDDLNTDLNASSLSFGQYQSGGIVTEFIRELEISLYNFVVKKIYEPLAEESHVFFVVGVTIWVSYLIISFFFLNKKHDPLKILVTFFKIMLASLFLSRGGNVFFVEYFYEPLVGTFYNLANFFTAHTSNELLSDSDNQFGSAVIQLEQLQQSAGEISKKIQENAPNFLTNAGRFMQMVAFTYIFQISIFLLLFLFAAYWSYSVFALHVLLAMTPIMVALWAFSTTRQYTFKWFSGIINYLTIPVVLAISMGFTLSQLGDEVNILLQDTAPTIIEGGNTITEEHETNIIKIIFICFLSFLVHLRVGEISAFLTGGVSSGLSSTWALGATGVKAGMDLVTSAPRVMKNMAAGGMRLHHSMQSPGDAFQNMYKQSTGSDFKFGKGDKS